MTGWWWNQGGEAEDRRGRIPDGRCPSGVLPRRRLKVPSPTSLRRFTQSGGMEILETPFTAEPSRQREVQTFVHKFRSIPAFTANLTMELFQKQTQC